MRIYKAAFNPTHVIILAKDCQEKYKNNRKYVLKRMENLYKKVVTSASQNLRRLTILSFKVKPIEKRERKKTFVPRVNRPESPPPTPDRIFRRLNPRRLQSLKRVAR